MKVFLNIILSIKIILMTEIAIEWADNDEQKTADENKKASIRNSKKSKWRLMMQLQNRAIIIKLIK